MSGAGRQRRAARISTVLLDRGDVDRFAVKELLSEIRLLVFSSEREPLVQARLSGVQARCLAELLMCAARRLQAPTADA